MPKKIRKPTAKRKSSPGPSETSVGQLTQRISRSQRGYRELIDHLDQALFTLSLEGQIRVANLRLSQIFSAPFQDLIGRPVRDFVESPGPAEMARALPAFLRNRSWSGTIPVRLKRAKELRYFYCWLQAVGDEERSMSVVGWARDVTAQHESEMRFLELFASIREGILFSTPDGRILDANPALVRMLGYDSQEELLRHNFAEMYDHSEDHQTMIRSLEEGGSFENRELVLRRKDGQKIHCLTSGFAIRDAAGRPVRLQATLVDVTERREIEKTLHREQEFVRRLVACFPDMIAVLDCEGRVTYVSERVRDVLGVTPQEYMARSMSSSTRPEDQADLCRMVQAIVRGRLDQAQTESRAQRADGSFRMLRAAARPMLDEEGRISGVVASVRDVTESHLAEQKMSQKEKFTAMGQMLAGAAHELNNPLTAILGVSDLLLERTTDDSTRHQIDLILEQSRRAAGIVQNLLAFSRPCPPGRTALRLDDLLREVLRGQSVMLREKNIAVQFEPPAAMPAVEGDHRLLSQALSNVIVNAQQSISSARDRGAIEISLRDHVGRVCVTIADDGPGIPRENLARIFDPFFTTKRPGGGSGLGLTISLAVVKDHGGTIEVSSTARGASFEIFLPSAGTSSVESRQAPSTVRSKPAGPEALAGHSVLVVDDEESLREMVQEVLSARGMTVHAVESSEEAMAYLDANRCDVVLCDFHLPGMSGDQFFERLTARRDTKRLPRFVFMTGDLADSESFDRLRQKGSRVLQKPFHANSLANLLVSMFESPR